MWLRSTAYVRMELMRMIPSEKAAAKRIPIAESSFSLPCREKNPMPRATATAAARAPTSRLPFTRYATATPGRMECAIASPMNAMERSTT